MNALTTIAQPADQALIPVMQNSLYPGARHESVGMVLAYCRARNLDPLKKPVHIVPMWVRPAGQKQGGSMQDVIMPGIDLYRIEAARTGEYAGKTEPEFGPTVTTDFDGLKVRHPEWCRMTVYRMVAGEARAFTAREYWMENYATAGRESEQPNTMWRKRAFGQLAKCAEAQALRMAFPEATGGAPTAEEMEGKESAPRDVPNLAQSAPPPAPPQQPVDADDAFPIIHPVTAKVVAIARPAWLRNVSKALAKLESADAVREWRGAMGPHIGAVSEIDGAMAMEADRMIQDRLVELVSPDAGEDVP